ncbi:DUF305 domain-containing protein [Mycolicibacterium brumae]|uniref:DUF305 domain-containing protein n=1 Tax=Mycolicibacterium brumae TaxID=85968 RepID=A0A2G5PG64_9MYCO|nr:DUF305 domain-containing protein [Mycolicibacterium brumae]MCV7194445.1 DUF305 domain-containing protein [Mycolicibacterium brumae]PIB77298.1 DUF305 domain-containing protein [Mycolicibacterium brumae]UWW10517.1 DUF305 domain-containing protein [Mycolicibacterium brumae]
MTSQPLKIFARAGIAVIALLLAVFMVSCSKSDDAAPGPDHNDADVTFAEHMIPHHEQAIELVELVAGRTDNAELLELAAQISDAQQPEIDTMTAWLQEWGPAEATETSETEHHGDHHGSGADPGTHTMAGMVDDATMAKLKTLKGADFDKLWLESMIGHHEGAIEMAKTEVAEGQNPAATAMAQEIIDSQQAEIDQMHTMLGHE